MGHVLRMSLDCIRGMALNWTPRGKRKQGMPREKWRYIAEKQLTKAGLSWGLPRKLPETGKSGKSVLWWPHVSWAQQGKDDDDTSCEDTFNQLQIN